MPKCPILLAIALALSACSQTPEATVVAKEGDRVPLVRVQAVEVREVRQEIDTTAYLESEHRVAILSKVAGRVLEVSVDEGEPVQRGQPLGRLDAREIEATKKQVAVQLEDRRVRARLAQLEVDAAGRREAQAGIDRARAKAELERLTSQDVNLVARKQLEEAHFAVDSAEQSLSVAGYNRRKAELDHEAANNSIAELEAKLEEVGLQRDEHLIVAPFDGVVVERHIRGGETINAATELFVVADLAHLITYLSRPQTQLAALQNAKEVHFTTDAYPGREFVADIDLISPIVDQNTGHVKVRARVRATDASTLRPGLFIRAKILTESKREALLVPKAALIADGEATVVFAVRGGLAYRLVLETGIEEQSFIECRNRGDEGLRVDDVVIVSGQQDLKDQARVAIAQN